MEVEGVKYISKLHAKTGLKTRVFVTQKEGLAGPCPAVVEASCCVGMTPTIELSSQMIFYGLCHTKT